MNKVFIISLPRTGTTSVCAALLEHDYKVAHTAFSKHTFELADVVADTPCYQDFRELDELFPDSKFVFLNRPVNLWIPSIQMLLKKIQEYIQPEGPFNPTLKRCFNDTFELQTCDDPLNPNHLSHCYQRHEDHVNVYFQGRDNLLCLDVSQADGLSVLLSFLGHQPDTEIGFPHLNARRMVTEWRDIKHANKVSSDAFGPDRRKFFDYASLK